MYSFVRRVLNVTVRLTVAAVVCGTYSISYAADQEPTKTIKGIVQNQDLRRVPQAVVEVKNQEGDVISSGVSNDAGEFKVTVSEEGTYSVSAVQETYRSEYVVLALGEEPLKPVTLTLSKTKEVSLEVVSPLPPSRPRHPVKPIHSAGRKSTSFREGTTTTCTTCC